MCILGSIKRQLWEAHLPKVPTLDWSQHWRDMLVHAQAGLEDWVSCGILLKLLECGLMIIPDDHKPPGEVW